MTVARLKRTHLSAVIALYAAEGWSQARDVERTWRTLSASGSIALVAISEEEVIGVAHVLTDGEIQAFLSLFVVARGFRGAGVGRRLVEEAHACSGARRMDLVSCNDGFYEALGARPVSGFRITAAP